jgi:hypothetical protein
MAAASYVGGQMQQGVQNIGDVRAMSGHFGSQFGQPGAGAGGQMGHQTIKKITGVLHELVGDDMRTTMEEIKTVMDQAGRMGMLTGISDAQTFKQKFGGIVKQVRQVADIMGTTLSEAAPMLGQLGSMGLWSGADIMGTAVAGRNCSGRQDCWPRCWCHDADDGAGRRSLSRHGRHHARRRNDGA